LRKEIGMSGKSLKGTRTEKNLLAAFAGESQARNRYDFFASQAKKDDYVQISMIFQETALNEKEHAKRFFRFLEGGGVEIQAAYPAGKIDDTLSNLEAAADGEKEEWGVLYPGFAETAREEGFPDVALVFTEIAKVEAYHERRYRKLAANIKEGTVFKRGAAARWKCNNCGYVHEGPEAPEICPACAHPRAYYELWVEAY
jgi:rubrerythrin